MNVNNLKKNKDRTKEELQAMGRKGGIASGKKRRHLRSLKDMLTVLLEAPIDDLLDGWTDGKLRALGIEQHERTQKMHMAMSLMNEAQKGNVRAIELVMKVEGEYPADRQELTISKQQDDSPDEITVDFIAPDGSVSSSRKIEIDKTIRQPVARH